MLATFAAVDHEKAAGNGAQLAGERPHLEKECGEIRIHGERLRVDIDETIGMKAHNCRTARRVMRKFIRTSPPVMGDGLIRDHGRRYDCYRSRPDGEGWEYHCNWSSSSSSASFRFIDYGAGRRF